MGGVHVLDPHLAIDKAEIPTIVDGEAVVSETAVEDLVRRIAEKGTVRDFSLALGDEYIGHYFVYFHLFLRRGNSLLIWLDESEVVPTPHLLWSYWTTRPPQGDLYLQVRQSFTEMLTDQLSHRYLILPAGSRRFRARLPQLIVPFGFYAHDFLLDIYWGIELPEGTTGASWFRWLDMDILDETMIARFEDDDQEFLCLCQNLREWMPWPSRRDALPPDPPEEKPANGRVIPFPYRRRR